MTTGKNSSPPTDDNGAAPNTTKPANSYKLSWIKWLLLYLIAGLLVYVAIYYAFAGRYKA